MEQRPVLYKSDTALEASQAARGAAPLEVILSLFFCLCTVGFVGFAMFLRGPASLIWGILGIVSGIFAFNYVASCYRRLISERKPRIGYLDQLKDLDQSRRLLIDKVAELSALADRQRSQQSDRAASRLKLLEAAIKNRQLKLDLVQETQFIIESKRKLSHLKSLSQQIGAGRRLAEAEKEIEIAFSEMEQWVAQAPECRSSYGLGVKQSLEAAMGMCQSIGEQIEDRLVIAALDRDGESSESQALERVHSFLETAGLDHTASDDSQAAEFSELVAADDAYHEIRTELRLMQDGITHDFGGDSSIDLDEGPESSPETES